MSGEDWETGDRDRSTCRHQAGRNVASRKHWRQLTIKFVEIVGYSSPVINPWSPVAEHMGSQICTWVQPQQVHQQAQHSAPMQEVVCKVWYIYIARQKVRVFIYRHSPSNYVLHAFFPNINHTSYHVQVFQLPMLLTWLTLSELSHMDVPVWKCNIMHKISYQIEEIKKKSPHSIWERPEFFLHPQIQHHNLVLICSLLHHGQAPTWCLGWWVGEWLSAARHGGAAWCQGDTQKKRGGGAGGLPSRLHTQATICSKTLPVGFSTSSSQLPMELSLHLTQLLVTCY